MRCAPWSRRRVRRPSSRRCTTPPRPRAKTATASAPPTTHSFAPHPEEAGMGDGDTGSERPRERLERAGPESLALIELLALVLRTGGRGNGALRLSQSLV